MDLLNVKLKDNKDNTILAWSSKENAPSKTLQGYRYITLNEVIGFGADTDENVYCGDLVLLGKKPG